MREKRGFENETWDRRAGFGTAASLEGGVLQPQQICNYLALAQTFSDHTVMLVGIHAS